MEYKNSYQIRSPLLQKIITPTKMIEFKYNKRLSEIMLTDYNGNIIERVLCYVDMNNRLLQKLVWQGSNSCAYKEQAFYYGSNGNLKKVILPTGGWIKIDYENFSCLKTDLKSSRVKMCRFSNYLKEDTITYNYLLPGQLVYNRISFIDNIMYKSGFSDRIRRKNSPIYKGNVFINQGNYGVYFECVEEVLNGQGSTMYMFSIPPSSNQKHDNAYAFWLGEKPLGKAIYDKDGCLVYMQRNMYLSDSSLSPLSPQKNYFEVAPEELNYNRYLWQAQPSDYYLNGEELRSHYSRLPKVLVYYDQTTNLYKNPSDIYFDNFQLRTKLVNSALCYKLRYGGKVLLKSQKEYTFPQGIAGGARPEHLTGEVPSSATLVSHVEFCYDHLEKTTMPTRVIKHQADGSQIVSVKRTVLDMQLVDPISVEMSLVNQINSVIKEQNLVLKPGGTSYRLISETITKYEKSKNSDNRDIFVPAKKYSYSSIKDNVSLNVPGDETKLFSVDSSKYQKMIFHYDDINGEKLLVESESLKEKNAICYDKGRNNPILKANNVSYNVIDAVDCYRTVQNNFKTADSLVAGLFLNKYLQVQIVPQYKKYKVFFLVNPSSPTISTTYLVSLSNGETSISSITKNVLVGKWQLVEFSIDLINIPMAQSLQVKFPASEIAMGIITPLGILFEANSYDTVGNLFGEFNHNGQLARYERDAQGRVVKIFDEDNNMLKEFDYDN